LAAFFYSWVVIKDPVRDPLYTDSIF